MPRLAIRPSHFSPFVQTGQHALLSSPEFIYQIFMEPSKSHFIWVNSSVCFSFYFCTHHVSTSLAMILVSPPLFLFLLTLFESRPTVSFPPGRKTTQSKWRRVTKVAAIGTFSDRFAKHRQSPCSISPLAFLFLSCHRGKAVAMATGSPDLIPQTCSWLA